MMVTIALLLGFNVMYSLKFFEIFRGEGDSNLVLEGIVYDGSQFGSLCREDDDKYLVGLRMYALVQVDCLIEVFFFN